MRRVLLESAFIVHGKPLAPSKKLSPGPPGMKMVVGAWAVLFLDSYHGLAHRFPMTTLARILTEVPKKDARVVRLVNARDSDEPAVRLHSWSCFADACLADISSVAMED